MTLCVRLLRVGLVSGVAGLCVAACGGEEASPGATGGSAGAAGGSAGVGGSAGGAAGSGGAAGGTGDPCALVPTNGLQASFFVDAEAGNDAAEGSCNHPFRTLEHARSEVRKLLAAGPVSGDVVVFLRGRFERSQTFNLTAEDSGKDGHHVVYRSYPNHLAVLDGGVRVTGWSPHVGSIFKAPLPAGAKAPRQLYDAGERQTRARSAELLDLDPVCTKAQYNAGGCPAWKTVTVAAKDLPPCDPCNAELHFVGSLSWRPALATWENISWRADRIPITKVAPHAGNKAWVVVTPKASVFADAVGATEKPIKAFDTFSVENDLAQLDEAGEWALDRASSTLYYWPKSGAPKDVFVPRLQELVRIDGASNLRMSGLAFRHGTFEGPNTTGVVVGQGSMWQTGGIKPTWWPHSWNPGRSAPPAAVHVVSASRLHFSGNRFDSLGALGVLLENDVKWVELTGNEFVDIADGGLLLGHNSHGAPPGGGVPVQNVDFRNNKLLRTGQDYVASEAVASIKSGCFDVSQNDIREVPHLGISLGWGWEPDWQSTVHRANVARSNHIEDYMLQLSDGGAVYTAGPSGSINGKDPGSDPDCPLNVPTLVEGNYIKRNAVDANTFKRGLQMDAGARNINWFGNVVVGTPQWIHYNDTPGGSSPTNTSAKGNYGSKVSWGFPNPSVNLGWDQAVLITNPPQKAVANIQAAAGNLKCQGRLATVLGTPGDDTLQATSGADVILGRGGNDTVLGATAEDLVCP